MYFELSELDRAFYEYLRIAIVGKNWLPDISILSEMDYFTQINTLISNEIRVVEIFGVGSVKDRDRVSTNKIVIDRIDLGPDSIGAFGTKHHKRTSPTSFERLARPAMTYSFTYQIGFVTDNTEDDRKLLNLILYTLGAMGCKQGIKSDGTKTENYFTYKQVDFKDNSDGDYFEKIFRYKISNVFISPDTVEDSTIGVLTEVEIDVLDKKDI